MADRQRETVNKKEDGRSPVPTTKDKQINK